MAHLVGLYVEPYCDGTCAVAVVLDGAPFAALAYVTDSDGAADLEDWAPGAGNVIARLASAGVETDGFASMLGREVREALGADVARAVSDVFLDA